MAATDFIVAIELGSSKITGIAGKKHPDGSIQVLALASEPSSDFIRKGVIYNLDKTAQSLTSFTKKCHTGFYRKGICRRWRTVAPHYPQHGSTPFGRRD